MARRLHRKGAIDDAASSSSDEEEDAFAALSSSKNKRPKLMSDDGDTGDGDDETPVAHFGTVKTAPTTTAANPTRKRHHSSSGNDARKQKLDALVQELSSQTPAISTKPPRPTGNFRGSFVQPGEEHLTTNLFVGNLPPSVTEEEVGNIFSQFGELYSVKIMYPRTAEERSRNRHSGFVCFRSRQDAQDALTACNERDVFAKGHPLQMNWGRRVEMTAQAQPVVPSRVLPDVGPESNGCYDAALHGETAIHVHQPSEQRRLQLISTVASFVAKDGSQLEQHLIHLYQSRQHPEFDFIVYPADPSQISLRDDHIYYKWRVYSFAQGDSWHVWNVAPFQLFRGGCFWIPPPLEEEAARREREAKQAEAHELQRQKEQRRLQNLKQNLLTGRQLENSQLNKSKVLSGAELSEFHKLTRENLSGSREATLKAMAFCFDKSMAADQIATLLKDMLLEDFYGEDDLDLVTARLFLVSDILFNSQQPGVKNAFRFRDAIERMAPEVFDKLHQYGQSLGRMTLSKLARVVRNVLIAWERWEVFHKTFLEELRARFDGGAPEEPAVMEQSDESSKRLEESDTEALKVDADPTEQLLIPSSSDFVKRSFEEVGVEDEDLDGEPFDEDVDGIVVVESVKELHEAPFEERTAVLDASAPSSGTQVGSTESDGDSIDGEPLDDSHLL